MDLKIISTYIWPTLVFARTDNLDISSSKWWTILIIFACSIRAQKGANLRGPEESQVHYKNSNDKPANWGLSREPEARPKLSTQSEPYEYRKSKLTEMFIGQFSFDFENLTGRVFF